jgi:transposase
MKRAEQEGIEGLKRRPPPGAEARLSEDERAKLPELLARGAPAHSFRGEVWACARVGEVIRKEFDVSYHPAHVSRLVRALGLFLQKPVRRANQSDEEAIRRWKEVRWPELKRGHKGGQDHLVRGPAGILLVAHGSAHLRPGGPNSHTA